MLMVDGGWWMDGWMDGWMDDFSLLWNWHQNGALRPLCILASLLPYLLTYIWGYYDTMILTYTWDYYDTMIHDTSHGNV